jgi:hypothetical protein
MTAPTPIKVIPITSAPVLKSLVITSGVPTVARAIAWAQRNGYATIWYWRRMERVYVEKKVKNE